MRANAVLPLAMAAVFAGDLQAQSTAQQRPIRMIVANAPGSISDVFGRILFARMAEQLGQTIVVDNRPGAGGMLGVELGVRAVPDGTTLTTATAAALTVLPHVHRKLGFDPTRDIAPVSLFVNTQTALCVNAQLPARTVAEFVELARAKPGQLNMSSAGVGSTSHLGGLLFTTLAKIEGNHVPYKGGGPSMVAVAQGEAQWTLGPLGAAVAHVKAGRIRCIATGGDRRSVAMPELPTIAESGVPGYLFTGWNGVFAPRGVAPAIITRLNESMRDQLASAELRALYLAQGEEPAYTTPAEFAALIRKDLERMGRLVKVAGLSSDN
ncbi:MAG: Bug family tripartite tricarboxylate transporter substrate binding protein [bacterium]|jgi:tripartite-type tricarboxylate transporter receptor subunit TctC|nr:tripartite tricarboxylate transporter substrate binding protein [Betaproteobacteria bacterium]